MTGANKEERSHTVGLATHLAWLAAGATRRYNAPTLSPALVETLDAQRHYAAWESSPEAETFRRLDAAGQSARVSEEVAERCWKTITQVTVGEGEKRAALLEVTPLITDHADALSVVWESLDAPFRLPPVRDADEPTPHFAGFRALARLLALDAARRLQHSDGDGALELCRVGMRFGLQVGHGSSLSGRRVSLALQALGRRFLWPALRHASLPALDATRQELQTAFASGFTFTQSVAVEQRFVLQGLLRSWETPFRREDPLRHAASLPLHAVTLLRGKPHVFQRHLDALEAWRQVENGPYCRPKDYPTAPAFVPIGAFGSVYFNDTLQKTYNRLALTALALHQYHRHFHFWPLRLQALYPRYLTTLPLDPFHPAEPLQYRRDGTGYLLYSVGPDGEDDDGRAIPPAYDTEKRVMTRRIWPESRGDIVAGVNL